MSNFLTSPDVKAMPREVFNWRLVFSTGSACMAGSLFGFDTGNIGGIIVLPSFKETFGLTANGPNAYQAPNLSANIVTALQAGAVLGALLAYTSADRLGRRWTLIIGAIVFLIGCILQLIARLSTLYAGRVIAGIATGLCSVVAPMYISETTPKAIRGAMTTCFNLIIVTSLSLAFWINYAVSIWSNPSNKQWRIPMAIQMIPGGLLLIGMIFQRESPRYLISHDRSDEAIQNLTYYRQLPADHPFVAIEAAEITESVKAETAAVKGSSVFSLCKEVCTVPANRRRYILAFTLQIFQQMTGTNAINYFAPAIFASVGLTGTSTSLLATGVYGIVKVCTTVVYASLIIDNVGRRKPLMTGAVIQACCLLYLTIFVKLATIQNGQVSAGGYVGVVAIYIYAFGWSFGWSVVPWVVPSEIFPNRIRAICMSSIFAWQWLLNFAITRATPYMMLNLDKWGAYLIFAVFTFASAIWAFFFLPELKGRSIESTDRLFEQSAFTMLKRAYPTEEEKTLDLSSRDKALEAATGTTNHIEESPARRENIV
ncbi:quinate permease [Penicillium lagena]|uniref:quinate permease n=1 Tax=Penicillium lagena TaxID=94218 RepID=UPI0025401DD4|nr:quinate permease [Penicillium lagena]KAJ5624277.1 quinate permease [Penicillium lagena]